MGKSTLIVRFAFFLVYLQNTVFCINCIVCTGGENTSCATGDLKHSQDCKYFAPIGQCCFQRFAYTDNGNVMIWRGCDDYPYRNECRPTPPWSSQCDTENKLCYCTTDNCNSDRPEEKLFRILDPTLECRCNCLSKCGKPINQYYC